MPVAGRGSDMRTGHVITVWIVLAMLASTVTHAGDYYKWTDAQGSVHYSQTAPTDHASKPVYVNDATPAALPPATGATASGESGNNAAKVQASQAALQNANAQALTVNCAAAQQNIVRLQSRSILVKSGDPPDTHSLDPQAREQALTDARNQAAIYCVHKP